MKNIAKYLGINDKEVKLYHENGKEAVHYNGVDELKTEYTYDKLGYVLTYENSRGGWCKHTRDNQGEVLTYENSNGEWCKYTRDDQGNELTYEDSDGFSSEHTYDKHGNELTYKDSDGVKRGFIKELTLDQIQKELGYKIKIVEKSNN